MQLDSISIREEPGRYESLALALRAVAEAAGGEIDYDALCAAMGVSFCPVSVLSEPAPGWWLVYGRDAFIEAAADLFGIRLRNLSPPDVGLEMDSAVEFPQHFEASYLPLIQTAIGNGQPVLAWQGWPETSAMFWGVVTRVTDGQLEGVTLWAEGRPRRLVAPALQCYVVETCNPVPPPRDRLLTMALQHADAYLNHAPFASGVANAAAPGIVTGPAAYDAWEAWLETGAFSASEADTGWREHRQHAEFMTTSRQSAIAFVSSIREIVPASQQLQVDAIIDACSQELNHLLPSCDEQVVCRAFATPAGRRTLLDALHRAEAASRRIASTIEEFTTVYQTVERPI